jgi:hypothetical protein
MRFYMAVSLLFIVFIGIAQESEPAIFETTKGTVSFVSDAPLEIIKASSNELLGMLRPDDRTFAFTMKTQSFKGFNSPLQQEHFYENYIESDKYPNARFKGKIIEPVDLMSPGEHSVRAKGILEIHGIEQERIIRVELKIDDDKISATSGFGVLLEDHDITIPKMVFQKIAETINVDIDLELRLQK